MVGDDDVESGNGVEPWKVWSKFILREIDRLGRCQIKNEEELKKQFEKLDREMKDHALALQRASETIQEKIEENRNLIVEYDRSLRDYAASEVAKMSVTVTARLDKIEGNLETLWRKVIKITAAAGAAIYILGKALSFLIPKLNL